MGDRFSYSVPPKTLMNFGESTIDSKGSAKETPIHSDLLCSQTVTNSKKRVLIDSSASLTTDMGVIEDTNYSDLKRKKTGTPDEDTGEMLCRFPYSIPYVCTVYCMLRTV